MLVGRHMTRHPVTVGEADTLETARQAMEAGGFRHLPVVSGERLVGVITDRDVREHVGHLADTRVTAAITEDAITLSPDATLEAAAKGMIEHQIGGFPVVEGGRLVGMLTTTDVLRAFLEITGAAEEGATRIDLVLEGGHFDLSEVSRIIAEQGAEILGIGTHRDPWDERPVFFVRMKGGDTTRIADALTEHGCTVLGVHGPSAEPRSQETSA